MESTPKQTSGNKYYAGLAVVVVAVFAMGAIYFTRSGRESAVPASNGGQILLEGDPSNLQGGVSATPIGFPTEATWPTVENNMSVEWISASWLPKWEKVESPACSPNYPCGDNAFTHYRAGKVLDGEFAGQTLYIMEESSMMYSYRHYVLDKENRPLFFDSSSPIFKIKGLHDLPEYIAVPGTDHKLRKGYVGYTWMNAKPKGAPLFTDPKVGPVYLSQEGNCLIVELPDHTAVSYDVVVPFEREGDRVMQFVWKDGKSNQTDAYTYTTPTCAGLCQRLNIKAESELNPEQNLQIAGKTSTGENIYEHKDRNAKVLKDIYADPNTLIYQRDPDKYEKIIGAKYTYEEFLNLHPLVYWKDPLGRWVEFKNANVDVAAEMCKPVIYLYSEKDLDVSVKVSPNGGFTQTIPEYGSGWNVRVIDGNKIFDKTSKQIYPYLFWEGIGLQYPQGNDGFVVERKNVEQFLGEVLPKVGLVGQEIVDFKEYWVKRLQNENSSYFHIRFLTSAEFNGIAPLSVTPRPSSIIRVMMTARPLSQNTEVATQILEVPQKRSAFTLVEWGGALLK